MRPRSGAGQDERRLIELSKVRSDARWLDMVEQGRAGREREREKEERTRYLEPGTW